MRRARTRLECPRAVSAIGAITLARVMVRYKGEQRQLVRGRRLMRRNRCSEGGGGVSSARRGRREWVISSEPGSGAVQLLAAVEAAVSTLEGAVSLASRTRASGTPRLMERTYLTVHLIFAAPGAEPLKPQ